jgi:hypothetical protein
VAETAPAQSGVVPRVSSEPASSHPQSSPARTTHPVPVAPAPVVVSPGAPRPGRDAAATPPPVLSPSDYRRPASSIPAAGDLDALAQCAAQGLQVEVPPWATAVERQLIVDNALRQCLAYFQR